MSANRHSLSYSLSVALRDCDIYSKHGPYICKPKSMEKLAALGLVERQQLMYAGRIAYQITDVGRRYLEAQR